MTLPPRLVRNRITYTKYGPQRFTGHLDLMKTWERSLRRAGLPIAYTKGFHPQPRIHLASALPLGFSGLGEVLDVWLAWDDSLDTSRPVSILPGMFPDGLCCRIQAALPTGLQVVSIEQIDLKAPALQTQVWAADYQVEITEPADPASLAHHVTSLLDAPILVRQRRGKTYDLRPLILDLQVSQGDHGHPQPVLTMRLQARESATGRPDEVVDCLGIAQAAVRITRLRLHFIQHTINPIE